MTTAAIQYTNNKLNGMKRLSYKSLLLSLPLLGLLAALISAMQQRGPNRDYGDAYEQQREAAWEVDAGFKHDVFTFARVKYSDGNGRGYGGWGRRGGGWGKWKTDHPDSDDNFSLRLQQLTSIKVNPHPVVVELSDPRLFDYPFLYMIEPGNMLLNPDEVVGLRKYCLNGGFMMVDDFWGAYEYRNFYMEMKKVFPEFEPQEVPLEHEIFQCVYPLKERPQVPAINTFYNGGTFEYRPESDTSIVSYQAIYDTNGRMMVFICHNTDLGDGWEREGENHEYFQQYAVPKSYPLGINIVTYAMTH